MKSLFSSKITLVKFNIILNGMDPVKRHCSGHINAL